MKRLIIVSTELEINPFLDALNIKLSYQDAPVLIDTEVESYLAITGIGVPSTLLKLQKILRDLQVEEIIQLGFAGSFNEEFPLGSLLEITQDCFGDSGFDDQGTFIPVKQEMPHAPGYFDTLSCQSRTNLPEGVGITVNTTSGSVARIESMKRLWNADVETMEGAAAMLFCQENGISFIQVRVISNWVRARNKSEWDMELAAANLSKWLIDYLKIEV